MCANDGNTIRKSVIFPSRRVCPFQALLQKCQIPRTAVRGWFSFQPTDGTSARLGQNPTNGSWWIVQVQPLSLAGLRLDLNHPPTSVGGIQSRGSVRSQEGGPALS